jgi:hypothetical protein
MCQPTAKSCVVIDFARSSALRSQQPGLNQPEIINALHQVRELVKLHGLIEVAVRVELISFCNIPLRARSGQDHYGYSLETIVLLDVSQNLAAIHFGEIQIEQDEIGSGSTVVGRLVLEKGNGLHAVGRHMQMDIWIGVAEGFLGQPNIAGIVFYQEDFYVPT